MLKIKISLVVFIFSISLYSQNIPVYKYHSPNFIWSIDDISDLKNGYDYQSHGSAQQVWLDLNNPDNLHAVFIYSAVADNAWADRTSLYFGSTDAGGSWFEVGAVPVNNGTTGRSGFPCIVGTSDGRAVISNHNNNAPHPTRSTIFIDNSPFENNFTEYDPGETITGPALYPKLAILPDNDIMMASGLELYTNKLSGGVFSGWELHDGYGAETYSLAVSENGSKAGLAYLGEPSLDQTNWVLYKETTDGGLTWSSPTIVWQAYTDSVTGNILGGFRGVNLIYNGEEPCIVFEVGWNNDIGYYPGLPSEIRFWSPNINGGNAKVLADSNNVPFFPNLGITDQQFPLSRPVIGRSQTNDYLFVAFNATTGDYWPGSSSADSTAFMCGMFMCSSDAGDTWTTPERFNPITTPPIDWRYLSIVPVSPVNEHFITVHLVMQGDPKPGSNINGWNNPPWVGAQYYHFSTDFPIINVQDDPKSFSSFNIEQNYPNPFNPSTKIKFTIPQSPLLGGDGRGGLVTLKVYDVLGNEIATLVNEELSPGEYEVKFDATNLPSGVYFYQLTVKGPKINSGQSVIQTKKMVLMK